MADKKLQVIPVPDTQEWDSFVCAHGGHPLQLSGWARVKEAGGWKSERLYVKTKDGTIVGGVQVLFRRLPWPFQRMAYVPRGPVVNDEQLGAVLTALTHYLRSQYKLLCVLVEPHSEHGKMPAGWRASRSTIMIPRTLILDLSQAPL
jgi:peptidoglycan pentaglycine glycine transferase (the first glycine)